MDLADGTVLDAAVRGRLHRAAHADTGPLAAGDEVEVSRTRPGSWVVEEVLPRRTVLLRPEVHAGRTRQILVANADVALLVFAHDSPAPSLGLVDRLLVGAAAGGVAPALVLNKCDLAASAEASRALALYPALGYRVLQASAATGAGVEEVAALVAGRCAVLAGPSGTGKSSLVNRIHPGVALRTGEISRATGRGRHTTTAARLVRAPSGGGRLVDTPGIREFGLAGIEPRALALHFPEFPEPGACRFLDCRHVREPGCEVLRAVQEGRVAPSRYRSYTTLLEELESGVRPGRSEPDGERACTPGRSP